MSEETERLFAQIHAIEEQIERRLDAHRAELNFRLANGRAVFDAAIADGHRRLRVGVVRYLLTTPLRHLALAPVTYAMVIPFALLDLSLTIYQWICFTAWGIRRVARRHHVVIDRHRLPYLNAIEKLNCMYCGYGNGVVAYAREIAARTEQYWCPIRHATHIRNPHRHYREFAAYGDAEAYRARLEELRARLR